MNSHSTPRRYHHGRLRQAAIEAAVAEVRAVGAAGVSMREIARRAGVSHAALAYQFGDKAGIFTAIATEGFRLAVETIGPAATGPDGFLLGGIAYIRFALTHPGHYEVMFRPDLYLDDDPDLVTARDAAFDLLYGSARASHPGTPADADVAGLVTAGWSLSHGFATLWLTANLQDRIGPDLAAVTGQVAHSLVTLGELAQRYLTAREQA
ncbi:TetR/AcrR family transcriptional regulator [Pseudonocardia acaciae]|uniref:TetR/AcrR family transcriptional regulator n=1 Tax=Pseudonocardia acaciae TaxID=551276 RepID=UPI0006868D9B|nr:TetR/AcrR family transcriptional regulator [Pseudonocardia acaciae]